ncbi:MAG: DUF711 family protein, ribonucleotide reductase and pyruvate formate lyase family [Candidatus Methanohalarchaeum thermophilum]|uniref:UPF0210 protein BTN85_0077 n=1 Tax=Methanohalarchaeum thermophilum TaxID=1903181 RepID=A0A1Q6DTC8_METT1|nr:MAG: DUF711 family protein, ribonucleotide reductase and pyruvate formate lyase family [Candidatus Methanohalarchaeum thermophilum]
MSSISEIFETQQMVSTENLDIRTVTMGIDLKECSTKNPDSLKENVRSRIIDEAEELVEKAEEVENRYGIPIVNKRISVTPISQVIAPAVEEEKDIAIEIAKEMDQAAEEVGVDFIGGFSALIHKGISKSDKNLVENVPKALAETDRVCSAINVASTKSGINMDAVKMAGEIVKKASELSPEGKGMSCTRLGIFTNAPKDNPFMPGAMHGVGESDVSLSVAISGPGVVRSVVEDSEGDFGELCEEIKHMAFKITRAGELIGRKVADELDIDFNIVDLSLAPTPASGDSVAKIIEEMGIDCCGSPGSTAALALLTDAVKKGGSMASSYVGGFSGSFIPVTEDAGMSEAVEAGCISIEKLEAMTSVCSVGLDMIPIPGDTSPETISSLIADECAIGIINNKSTGVRLIPVKGKKPGEKVEFGGLLGESPILDVKNHDLSDFISRGGRIPASIKNLNN